MSGIELLINETWTDVDLNENWKTRQDAQHRRIDARLVRHWALDYATTIEGALTFGFLAGPIVSAAGVVTMGADGTIALTDNATNYVERTLAGVVSANTSGFTTGRLPMYKITVAASVFTVIEDWRVFGTVAATALLAIAGLAPAADKFAYFTSGTAAALADLTSFARTLLDDADAATMRATLSVPSISYVDTLVAGLDMKASVRVATTGNVNLANALENGDTIDGVALATGDRVLVKSQSAPAENGIYIVPASGAAARATDADAWAELPGAFVAVEEGTANADTVWLCTANAGGTLNTTAVTFTQFGGGTVLSTGITDSTTAGRALLTAADEDAQRTLLSVEHYSIQRELGNGTTAIVAGEEVWVPIDIDGDIVEVTLLADAAGDVVLDLQQDTFANFPPTGADSLINTGAGGVKPTLSTARTLRVTSFANWTVGLIGGRILRIVVDSAATITRLLINIKVKRT